MAVLTSRRPQLEYSSPWKTSRVAQYPKVTQLGTWWREVQTPSCTWKRGSHSQAAAPYL